MNKEQGIVSDIVMDGDIVNFNGIPHQAHIQGYHGSYLWIKGMYLNRATDNFGFMENLLTGVQYRARWGSVRILCRAIPELFDKSLARYK